MSKQTKRRIADFANGKPWLVIEIRAADYIIKIGDSIWCIRKANADR